MLKEVLWGFLFLFYFYTLNEQVFDIMFGVQSHTSKSSLSVGYAESYRFGFGGQMKDNEVKGNDNYLDFGARGYDPRLGRWMATEPLSREYPSQSPYNFVANNPIIFIDPDGRKIRITGDKSGALVKRLNEVSGGAFYLDGNELKLKNPDAKVVGVFMELMKESINRDETITLHSVEQNKRIFVDAFANGDVDVDDLLNVDDLLFQASVGHIIVERFAVDNYDERKKIGKSINRIRSWDYKGFDQAHDKALSWEMKLLEENYPNSNIKFPDEYFDFDSEQYNIKTNTGTIDFVFDFGDVLFNFTQKVSSFDGLSDEVVGGGVKGKELPTRHGGSGMGQKHFDDIGGDIIE